MALITARVTPFDDVKVTDIPSDGGGRIAAIEFDDVWVGLGGYVGPEDIDASIVATANLLIGVLVGLRDAAARRIADANVVPVDMAPGEFVAIFGK